MTSSYNIMMSAAASPAQTVPKAKSTASGGVGSSNSNDVAGSYYDGHENHLLHVNSVRVSSAAASSAPGPGLTNGRAGSDAEMRWWW
ncbi:NAD kinase [Drosophila madeirensis]|uniref:NAD kinase n=2 Tax=obscura subgroup TaxID=32357 RepID=A0AAU9GBP3_DROMD